MERAQPVFAILPDVEATTQTETALVRAARNDPVAFGILYQRYLPRIYRYLRARSGSDEDAADLAQQVFLRALDAIPNYHERGLPFAAWLFRIARNLVIDGQRARRITTVDLHAVEHLTHAPGNHTPEVIYLHEEELTQLRSLLASLEPSKRELLELRFAAELSTREIAAVVGKREAAVRKQISRTLHTLKEHYDASR
jgi:RNA polymerase sigma-70 factor (ECF subfamily)